MRCLLTTTLALATLAGTVCAHLPPSSTPLARRKTLGFGPTLPHAEFRSSPYQISTSQFTPQDPSKDPIDVARLFVEDVLLSQDSDESRSYVIRKDSYTDKNTGVSHVYVRQIINGLEVIDGDMNVNVKDGMVISYGNSFYRGPAPAAFASTFTAYDARTEHCADLESAIGSHFLAGSGQVPMSSQGHAETLSHLHKSNCLPPSQPSYFSSPSMDEADPRPALLYFLASATPNSSVSDRILENFATELDNLEVTPVSHLADNGAQHELHISGAPEAVGAVKTKVAYAQVPDGNGETTLERVWRFEVEMQDNWYEVSISSSDPSKIVSVVDWASDSPMPLAPIPKEPTEDVTPGTYKVFAWGVNDPECGERTVEKENIDAEASPMGWHAIPEGFDPSERGWSGVRRLKKGDKVEWNNYTTTWGNNVFAQENWEGQNSFVNNYRPDGGVDKKFEFKYSPKETEKPDALEEAQKYINNTVAQLFYTSNLVHDLYYAYGFDEVSGNFQQYNFGRGGAEGDAVIANAQDGSGYNNANFMTPPDGQNGRMRMYLWNTAVPYRDGDLEAGIVIHELSHGLSTRLTGGPKNSGCLGWGESGGMGEGWGDWLATTIRSTQKYSDYPMGSWAANRDNGIRNYPYSLNDTVNPSTYKTLDKPGYWGVHAIGEVWAEILWVVSNRLIAKHGFSDSLFPSSSADFYRPAEEGKPLIPKTGNALAVQLVLNGMKLQPCRPSFFDARDAIIQADQVLTGGENFCELWKGFSERGLGVDAKVEGRTPWGGGVRTNGYTLPSVCLDEE
ncbi:extracellular elastinolytic metallo proteinase [Cyathus striatus]|nr:extracellular elastinolytic metallo proteinase [Cyathus striatus]